MTDPHCTAKFHTHVVTDEVVARLTWHTSTAATIDCTDFPDGGTFRRDGDRLYRVDTACPHRNDGGPHQCNLNEHSHKSPYHHCTCGRTWTDRYHGATPHRDPQEADR